MHRKDLESFLGLSNTARGMWLSCKLCHSVETGAIPPECTCLLRLFLMRLKLSQVCTVGCYLAFVKRGGAQRLRGLVLWFVLKLHFLGGFHRFIWRTAIENPHLQRFKLLSPIGRHLFGNRCCNKNHANSTHGVGFVRACYVPATTSAILDSRWF